MRTAELQSLCATHAGLEEYSTTVAAPRAIAADLVAEAAAPCNCNLLQGLQAAFHAAAQPPADPPADWSADGAHTSDEACRQQLLQHVMSWWYLWQLPVDERLTAHHVRQAHSILMHGAVGAGGERHFAGKFRTRPAFASSSGPAVDAFVHPTDIESRLAHVLATLRTDDLGSIARFLEQFLYVHPFLDGNGRLARLLVARCLKQHGLPFPVSLACSGGTPAAASKRYMQVLLRARQQRGAQPYEQLRLFLVEAICLAWQAFADYTAAVSE
jgi:hypothetical protein